MATKPMSQSNPVAQTAFPAILTCTVLYAENGDCAVTFLADDEAGQAALRDLRDRLRRQFPGMQVTGLERGDNNLLKKMSLVFPRTEG